MGDYRESACHSIMLWTAQGCVCEDATRSRKLAVSLAPEANQVWCSRDGLIYADPARQTLSVMAGSNVIPSPSRFLSPRKHEPRARQKHRKSKVGRF